MDAMLPATTISTVAGLSSAQFYGSGVLGARYDAFTLEQRLDASAAQHLGGADASDAGVDYDATDDLLDFEITARQAESIARADQRAMTQMSAAFNQPAAQPQQAFDMDRNGTVA
jgi:hypothetical protein